MLDLEFTKCPRCGGSMVIEKEEYGWYGQCLQCSHERELNISFKPEELSVGPITVTADTGFKNLHLLFLPVTSNTLK